MNVALLITLTDVGGNGSSSCLEECQRQIEAISAEEKYSFSFFLNEEGAAGRQKMWEKASATGFDF